MIKLKLPNLRANTIGVLLFIFLATSKAFAGGHVISIEEKVLPEFLFHWLDKPELSQKWRLDTLETSGKLPVPYMRGFRLVREIQNLLGKPGIFAWQNPVAGIGYPWEGEIKFYGSMLLAIETTKKPVKIMTIETGLQADGSLPDFSGVDMIFHRRFEKDTLLWEEWVILNPDVAKSFTVNPEVVKEIIKPIYEKMKQGYQFPIEEMHYKRDNYSRSGPETAPYNSEPTRKKILALLEAYFEMTPNDVPPAWLKRSDCFDLGSIMNKFLNEE